MICTRTVLLGAELKGLDAHSNYQRTNDLRSDLLKLGLSFVGISNVSTDKKSQLFMVEGVQDLESVKSLARKYNQGVILTLDEDKNTEVVPTKSTGRAKGLGKLVQVNKAVAVKQNFYLTFVEDGKEYFFVTKKGVVCE